MSREVDKFFAEAEDHGYDTAKVRRCVEEEIRRIGTRNPELFRKVLFTVWKILKMSFGAPKSKK